MSALHRRDEPRRASLPAAEEARQSAKYAAALEAMRDRRDAERDMAEPVDLPLRRPDRQIVVHLTPFAPGCEALPIAERFWRFGAAGPVEAVRRVLARLEISAAQAVAADLPMARETEIRGPSPAEPGADHCLAVVWLTADGREGLSFDHVSTALTKLREELHP